MHRCFELSDHNDDIRPWYVQVNRKLQILVHRFFEHGDNKDFGASLF